MTLKELENINRNHERPTKVAFKLGPGQGKSIITLLIALFYVRALRLSVLIVVPYKVLEK